MTLLSLLALKPGQSWEQADDPFMGITPMMEFFSRHYRKRYAPNTRETVRRHSVHQLIQAALVVPNPDDPSRPTNSPKAVYQIEPAALKVLRTFGKPNWPKELRKYLQSVQTLKRLYTCERNMRRIPVTLQAGGKIDLSPGEHNALVKSIVDQFCPLYASGGRVIYVGDTQKKWAYFDSETLIELGVRTDKHGKMPDVAVYDGEENWLILVEAVTSHGPVNPKRRRELKELFAGSKAGLVYVTAFIDRRTMMKYLDEISWETEVWVADSPTHLIHFNGKRFLGPYEY